MTKHRSKKYNNRIYTIPYTDFLGIAATSGDKTFLSSLPGALIDHVLVKPRVAFTDAVDTTFTDGVFNSDTSLVSATAAFIAADVGKTVTGTGIPDGTTIASRTNSTTVVLSQATTATGTGKTFTIKGRTKITALTGRVITANHNYGTAYDILQAPGDEVFDSDITRFREKFGSAVDFKFHLAATGGNLSTLTAGEVDIIVALTEEGVDY